MANASTTGFGLRAVMNVGNTPATSGQSEYLIQTAPGVATNKGDPMSFNDGGATAGEAGMVQDAPLLLLTMVEQAEQAGQQQLLLFY